MCRLQALPLAIWKMQRPENLQSANTAAPKALWPFSAAGLAPPQPSADIAERLSRRLCVFAGTKGYRPDNHMLDMPRRLHWPKLVCFLIVETFLLAIAILAFCEHPAHTIFVPTPASACRWILRRCRLCALRFVATRRTAPRAVLQVACCLNHSCVSCSVLPPQLSTVA